MYAGTAGPRYYTIADLLSHKGHVFIATKSANLSKPVFVVETRTRRIAHMTKVVVLTGTHGSGKTTVYHYVYAHLKRLGYNVDGFTEQTPNCPFQINEEGDFDTQLWITATQLKCEIVIRQRSFLKDIIIFDRGIMDPMYYSYYLWGCGRMSGPEMDFLQGIADNYPLNYDSHILFPPLETIKDDGIRSINVQYQTDIWKITKDYWAKRQEADIHLLAENSELLTRCEESLKLCQELLA